jgi:hypothetical protein
MNQRISKRMEVLTVTLKIFDALTLILSVYGMNFGELSELGCGFDNPMVILLMVSIGVEIGWFLKQEDWFNKRRIWSTPSVIFHHLHKSLEEVSRIMGSRSCLRMILNRISRKIC